MQNRITAPPIVVLRIAFSYLSFEIIIDPLISTPGYERELAETQREGKNPFASSQRLPAVLMKSRRVAPPTPSAARVNETERAE